MQRRMITNFLGHEHYETWGLFAWGQAPLCRRFNQRYLTLIRNVVGLHAYHSSLLICSNFMINVFLVIVDVFLTMKIKNKYSLFFIPTVA